MTSEPIAARYAEALFAVSQDSNEIDEVLTQLVELRELLKEHSSLRSILVNPGISAKDKLEVLDRLTSEAWSGSVRAFIHMVISLGRAEFIPAMIDALQDIVEIDRGRLRVTVISAHPISKIVIARLAKILEKQEHKKLVIDTKVDPELIGGIEINLGNRVINGSVRQSLRTLRQRLTSVKVH